MKSNTAALLVLTVMLFLSQRITSFCIKRSSRSRMMSISSSSSSADNSVTSKSGSTSTSSNTIIPRAAVSVIVRSPSPSVAALASSPSAAASSSPSFILVQRGQEPNKGLWSLPGGKLEAGETTLQGGQRELHEECQVAPIALQWYSEGAICVTDSIHYHPSNETNEKNNNNNNIAFHYVIAQCFATAPSQLPLIPSDDAADANWFTMDQVQTKIDAGATTLSVLQVLQRAERLYQAGMLL